MRDSVTADLNGDGFLDVVSADISLTHLQVFLAVGPGELGPPLALSAMSRTEYVAAADLDGDSDVDIVGGHTSSGSQRLQVWLNDGDGTFGDRWDLPVGVPVREILLHDVNGDGYRDVVMNHYHGFSTFLNDGLGRFTGSQTIGVGEDGCRAPVVADFDADGDNDVAISGFSPPAVHVYLNAGDGSFVAHGQLPAARNNGGLASGDVNADGFPDLLVGENSAVEAVLWLNDGAAQFQPGWSVSAHATECRIADVNGDRRPDLVLRVEESEDRSLHVALQQADGTFAAPLKSAVSSSSRDIEISGFDADRFPDAVFVVSGAVGYLRGRGDGTFHAQTPLGVGPTPAFTRLADLDGDGDREIITSCRGVYDYQCQCYVGGELWVYWNQASGVFSDPTTLLEGLRPGSQQIADFDRDGMPEMVVLTAQNDELVLLRATEDRVFEQIGLITLPEKPRAVYAADMDSDGDADLLVHTHGQGTDLFVRLDNDGAGGFARVGADELGMTSPSSIVLADLDADGFLDVAGSDAATGRGYVWWNDGLGNLAAGGLFGSYLRTIAVTDINGDGPLDIIATTQRGLSVWLNDGARGFPTGRSAYTEREPWGPVVGDLDNDGVDEVLCTFRYVDGVGVFRPDDQEVMVEVRRYQTPHGWIGPPVVGRLNDDAAPDLVMVDRNVNVAWVHYAECTDEPCPGDFNGDGSADSRDVIEFLNAWVVERTRDCSAGGCSTDLDANGVVDTRDCVLFLNAWGAGC